MIIFCKLGFQLMITAVKSAQNHASVVPAAQPHASVCLNVYDGIGTVYSECLWPWPYHSLTIA